MKQERCMNCGGTRDTSPHGLEYNLTIEDGGHIGGQTACGDMHEWADATKVQVVLAIVSGLEKMPQAPKEPMMLVGPLDTMCGHGVEVRLGMLRGHRVLQIVPVNNPKTRSNWGLPTITIKLSPCLATAYKDIHRAADYVACIVREGWTMSAVLPEIF